MSTVATEIPTLTLDDLNREELLFVVKRAFHVTPSHMAMLISPADMWDARADREARIAQEAIASTIDHLKQRSRADDALISLYCAGAASPAARRRVREWEDRRDKAQAAYARASRAYDRHNKAEDAARANARRLREAGR